MKVKISLNDTEIAVLFRCLAYGQAAISEAEHESGKAEIILEAINDIRSKVVNKYSENVLEDISIYKKDANHAFSA